MLIELDCDQFYHDDERPGPFRFDEGLNTVTGTDKTANSIGKSTLLMIVDYCFGGEDYPKLCKDVIKNIGHHEIKFAFVLGGETFYYKRATDNVHEVFVCDSSYGIERSMKIDSFREFLATQYGLGDTGVTFRNAISGFFRIWQRKNMDVDHPLESYRHDTLAKGVRRLLALYGYLTELDSLIAARDEAERQVDLSNMATRRYGLPRAENISAVKANEERIKTLEEQRNQAGTKAGMTAHDYTPAQQAAILSVRAQRTPLQRRRTQITNQLQAIQDEKGLTEGRTLTKGFSALQEFFPDIDLERLSKIEAFHFSIREILQSEYKRETKDLTDELTQVDVQLKQLDRQLAELQVAPTVSAAEIRSYSAIDSEIRRLYAANKGYYEHQTLLQKRQESKEQLAKSSEQIISSVENNLNRALQRIDGEATNEQRNAPEIAIDSVDKYHYSILDDTGTGSTQRGLVSFDLALLETTKLPAIAHDTVLVQPIEDEAFEGIVRAYQRQSKQVFLAIDNIGRYDDETQAILTKTRFVHLEPGRELFGRSWSKKKKADKTNE